MKSFRGTDYYDGDDLLSNEQRAFRQTLRTWVDRAYLPVAAKHFEEGTFPLHLIPDIAGMGLLGLKLSDYGCPGKSSISYGIACQELERGDSGLRSFVSVTNSLVMFPIHRFGSQEQKDRWLPAIARGEKIGCFALTEPASGSDPSSMQTEARPQGPSHYILNGRKMWISNGEIADIAIVWARTPQGIRPFLVEKDTPGYTARPILRRYSQRASFTSVLNLKNVRLPAANLLPDARGLKAALQCLNEARYGIAWGAVGAAMACYETALDYARERIQFQVPIASFQLVQEKLVNMLTEITKAQLLCIRLGQLKDAGRVRHPQISLAKRNNVFQALKIARAARAILGANGISLRYPVMRHLLNLEAVYTYEGTHDIHTLSIGRDITGHSAFTPHTG